MARTPRLHPYCFYEKCHGTTESHYFSLMSHLKDGMSQCSPQDKDHQIKTSPKLKLKILLTKLLVAVLESINKNRP